jgi:hypothetical protein
MNSLAFAKTVLAAVICGTGATAGIVLYPHQGAIAIWIAVAAVAFGFALAAIPVKRRNS